MENTDIVSSTISNCIGNEFDILLKGLGAIVIFYLLGETFFRLQIHFGNYLKHTHPKSWLRKIWWSSCDLDNICEYCEEKLPKCTNRDNCVYKISYKK